MFTDSQNLISIDISKENSYNSCRDMCCVGCDDQAEGALRLTGGENKFSGQVEICHEPPGGEKMKRWFPVCGNRWDINATIAAVVCAHLGFSEREARIDDASKIACCSCHSAQAIQMKVHT